MTLQLAILKIEKIALEMRVLPSPARSWVVSDNWVATSEARGSVTPKTLVGSGCDHEPLQSSTVSL